MTVEDLEALFKGYADSCEEFLKFDRVERKRSGSPDLHAFLLLAELAPQDRDMISAAEHDQIFLRPDLGELAGVVTEDQVKELVRCGVLLDAETGSLFMWA